MGSIVEVSSTKCFGGLQKVFKHASKVLNCEMKFSIYLPGITEDRKAPVLYFLSGLTCTEQNFIEKSGAQRHAAEHGIIIVGPDTSPRNVNIEGQDESYDFGSGAGFYLNATEPKWKEHYNMFSYVTEELPSIINNNFPVIPNHQSIFGHSMGGHGALVAALKCPGKYQSVSAFAPICNPSVGPWGKKAFSGYLGENEEQWKEYDATYLVKQYSGPPYNILIDQGSADKFLPSELFPENFVKACAESRMPVVYRLQEGYDHSYYFISTFIGDHIEHHARILNC